MIISISFSFKGFFSSLKIKVLLGGTHFGGFSSNIEVFSVLDSDMMIFVSIT